MYASLCNSYISYNFLEINYLKLCDHYQLKCKLHSLFNNNSKHKMDFEITQYHQHEKLMKSEIPNSERLRVNCRLEHLID